MIMFLKWDPMRSAVSEDYHTQISRITRGECTAHLMAHSVSSIFGLKKPSYEPSEGEELTLTAKCKVKE